MSEHDLTLRPTFIGGQKLSNDYCIIRDGRSIGRIREATERAGSNPCWTWAINPPLPIPTWATGQQTSFDAAKVAFRAAWERFYETLTPDDIEFRHHSQDARKRS